MVTLAKFCRNLAGIQISLTKESFVNSIAIYKEYLTSHFQIKKLFCCSTWGIDMTNFNLLRNLHWENFRLHLTFQIMWVPIEMNVFRL